MMWNRKVFIRIIEVLLCIACVVALRVTDDESRRVFHYLRNRSREWSLLNNVTWGSIGAALATATCGGYIIITVGLLIAAVTGELSGRITELFLLGLGVILFGVVGSLSLASIESVPEDLIDNAAVLGALCLVTALVFIADLLMSAPGLKKKHDGTQTFLDKETAASIKPSTMPTLSLESESRVPKTTASENGAATSTAQLGKKAGTANDVFDDSDEPRRARNIDDEAAPSSSQERDHEAHFSKVQRPKVTEVRSDERDRGYEPDERQSREYAAQNFENGRTLRDSQRFRDPERDRRDDNKIVRNLPRIDRDEGKIFYQGQDFRQRPADELDTPLFPATRDSMPEPMFAKIVNPSVKIMRVDRDPEDTYDTRYSDSSQYDNVPTRINGHPEGILKRRDVSFNVPSSLRAYRAQAGPNKDDIEMLEEWINVLKTSTGSQTGRSPSSPTDPGYVRHTVSNWPRELKSKTPSASPERPTSNR